MKGHPGFLAVLDEIRTTHLSKGHDYGTNKDTFANVRSATDFGIPAWLGCVLRANDKVQRVKSFATKGTLMHEGIEDALLDAANYFAIALTLYREESATSADLPPQEPAKSPTLPNTIAPTISTKGWMEACGKVVDGIAVEVPPEWCSWCGSHKPNLEGETGCDKCNPTWIQEAGK